MKTIADGVKVSVIVPVHNTATWLERCVDSLRRQTLRELEIVLVENGSTDGSAAACDALAAADARIRVLHLGRADLSRARNAGLEVAAAPYVGFVDSDDYVEPDMFELLWTAVVRYDAEMACCDPIVEPEDAPQTVEPTACPEMSVRTPAEVLTELLLEERTPAVWLRLFDRRLFEGLPFPPDALFEDHRTLHRWVARCRRVVQVDRACYHYVQHGGSICHTFTPRKHYHFFLANYDRFEFVCGGDRIFDGAWPAAVYDRLVRSCLWNFKEAMRRERPADFSEPVRDMRGKLERIYRARLPLPRATRRRLWRVVRCWPFYYLIHFALRKKR